MINDPPILRIRRNFTRPVPALLGLFENAATGHLVDAMGGNGAMDWRIKPIGGVTRRFCGPAITCDAGAADNLALFGALDAAKPGDVLVVATGGHVACAVLGDLLAGMARNCGIAAIVTDGAVRDVAGILDVKMPVFAAGVSPNSPARNGPGSVGLPVVVAGLAVHPGDIIVGDGDGVAVVPVSEAAGVAAQLEQIRLAESTMEAEVRAGLRIPDSVAALLKSRRVEDLA